MNSLPWLKLFVEARVDRKLAHLTLAERGVWVNLLCFASEQEHETRGTFDASDRYLLAMECAEGDEAILTSTLEKLQRSKHLIAVEGKDGWLAFRTYAERQARKPSDAPEATRERQRRSRASRHSNAMSRDVTRDGHEKRNVTRLDIREESREDRDNPLVSLSGKVSTTIADVAASAPPAAAAVTLPSNHNSQSNHWDDLSARRTADEVARKARMSNTERDALIDYIKACRMLSHELVVAEGRSFATWLNKNHISAEARVFYNKFLKPRNDELSQQHQGKDAMNGHQQQSQQQQPHHTAGTTETEFDRLYAQRVEQQKQQRAASS